MLTGSVVVLLRYSLIVFFLHPTLSSSRHAEVGLRGGLSLWDRGCARLKFPLSFFNSCSLFHGIIDPSNPQSLTSVLLLHEPTNLSEEGLPTPKIAHITTGLSQIVEARGFIIGNSPVIRPFVFNPQTNSAY